MRTLLDVHTHTIASGHAFSTMQEMAQAAAEKGLQLLGITEHAPGIPGTCAPIYFKNLRCVPRQMYGVELMLGVELNILNYQGDIDMEEELLRSISSVIRATGPRRSISSRLSSRPRNIIPCWRSITAHSIPSAKKWLPATTTSRSCVFASDMRRQSFLAATPISLSTSPTTTTSMNCCA